MELRPDADEWPSSGEDRWRKGPSSCIDEQQQRALWPDNGLCVCVSLSRNLKSKQGGEAGKARAERDPVQCAVSRTHADNPTDGELKQRLPFGRTLGGGWVSAVQSHARTLTDNCCEGKGGRLQVPRRAGQDWTDCIEGDRLADGEALGTNYQDV
ncbi:uncharacterized protein PG986_013637 [Apiospora aurea]|uniref:Uncharacterized protein n=1 Tax=Apiospora aurea TaxID=335848 RepID=A0ABR1PW65_9PEZI